MYHLLLPVLAIPIMLILFFCFLEIIERYGDYRDKYAEYRKKRLPGETYKEFYKRMHDIYLKNILCQEKMMK
jgi:hypothetical protein